MMSFNGTLERSALSTNWRVKSQPTSIGMKTDRERWHHEPPDGYKRHEKDEPGNYGQPKALDSLRGENDPLTMQAIEEGRRLYVGNLPYMAKTKDILDLFASGGYSM